MTGAKRKPGTRVPAVGEVIERVFKGKRLKVTITESGFRYRRMEYGSLTAVARKVTGYKAVSGPAFFGFTKRKEGSA